jgi:hypothetical protein
MLKSSSDEGLLPHEDPPAVLLHQCINRPVNLLLEEGRVLVKVMWWESHQKRRERLINSKPLSLSIPGGYPGGPP